MQGKNVAVVLLLVQVAVSLGLKVQEFDDTVEFDSSVRTPVGFQGLSFIQLESHEDTPTPPFSVCKYLLEAAAPRVSKGDDWADIAKHIASIRETLPEHVRSACDGFIKRNRDDIISLLQIDELGAALEAIADKAQAQSDAATGSAPPATVATADDQQELFRQFWEEKGKFCGACLTLTKKIQKWLSLNCTQALIADRVIRMCDTMTGPLRDECAAGRIWVQEYILKHLFAKLSLPNHCAYIGLCEKTMVIRALASPVIMSERQTALIQDIEGVSPNLEQEGESVFQRPHDTPDTAPEVTFDLLNGDVSYRDVDKSTGAKLPKVYIDGSHEASAFLETASTGNGIFDVSNPDDPHVQLNAQDPKQVDVAIMHDSLKQNGGVNVQKNYGLQGNHLPIESKFLKGCAACQFTIGALFEFLSNPRTIRTILPTVKAACRNCNSPEEIAKCEDFVEIHGVAFYQDVIRQGMPSKWCPRLELCEIQYFYPSPFVLSDAYSKVEAQLKGVGDF